MSTEMISVRIDSNTRERLESAAKSAGASRSALLTRYVEEGLRMDAHPGIVFRRGPGGRRPGLPGGPDVWEVARIIRNSEVRGDKAIDIAADWLGLPRDQVQVAVGYYAQYREEVDRWIDRLDKHARDAEEAWRRRMDLLR